MTFCSPLHWPAGVVSADPTAAIDSSSSGLEIRDALPSQSQSSTLRKGKTRDCVCSACGQPGHYKNNQQCPKNTGSRFAAATPEEEHAQGAKLEALMERSAQALTTHREIADAQQCVTSVTTAAPTVEESHGTDGSAIGLEALLLAVDEEVAGAAALRGGAPDVQQHAPGSDLHAPVPTLEDRLKAQHPEVVANVDAKRAHFFLSLRRKWAVVHDNELAPATCPVKGTMCTAIGHRSDSHCEWFALQQVVSVPVGRSHDGSNALIVRIISDCTDPTLKTHTASVLVVYLDAPDRIHLCRVAQLAPAAADIRDATQDDRAHGEAAFAAYCAVPATFKDQQVVAPRRSSTRNTQQVVARASTTASKSPRAGTPSVRSGSRRQSGDAAKPPSLKKPRRASARGRAQDMDTIMDDEQASEAGSPPRAQGSRSLPRGGSGHANISAPYVAQLAYLLGQETGRADALEDQLVERRRSERDQRRLSELGRPEKKIKKNV